MNELKIKLLASILISSSILGISIFSLKIKKIILSKKKLISFLNCFIAGLFISLSMIHILPNADKNLKSFFFENEKKNDFEVEKKEDFPLSYFLCLFSFFVFFVFDKYFFLENFDDYKINKIEKEAIEIEMEIKVNFKSQKNNKNLKMKNKQNRGNKSMFKFTEKEIKINILNLKTKKKNFANSEKKIKKNISSLLEIEIKENSKKIIKLKKNENKISKKSLNKKLNFPLQKKRLRKKFNYTEEKKKIYFCEEKNKLRYYSIITIIIINGFLEGINFGLNINKKIYKILITILFHKWAEVFILSIFLLKKKITIWNYFFYIFVFGLLINFGIFFGNYFFLLKKIFCFLNCFVAGVFFYLSCAVLTFSEFSNSKNCLEKFFFYCFGIGFVLIVRYFQ